MDVVHVHKKSAASVGANVGKNTLDLRHSTLSGRRKVDPDPVNPEHARDQVSYLK
jgi:hypothetical protein